MATSPIQPLGVWAHIRARTSAQASVDRVDA
jgi:hypothetical protein